MTPTLAEMQGKFEHALSLYCATLPNTSLYEPIRYILSLGGKRIRPVLVMIAADAYQADETCTIRAALAVEIFHNFSLVHDDIMDAAPLRRGKATVHARWNENLAILSGDAMLIEAYKQLAGINAQWLKPALDLFNKTSSEVCEGQQLDMEFEKVAEVSVAGYTEMIGLKTAVLLGCCLKMGAMLGGASTLDADALYQFGKLTGVGFQIQDDYLDAFGNPDQFGKQVGGDILANKKTFLVAKAMEVMQPSDRKELQRLMSQEPRFDPTVKIREVTAHFRRNGIDEAALLAIESYFMQAEELLRSLELSEGQKEPFRAFARQLMVRKA